MDMCVYLDVIYVYVRVSCVNLLSLSFSSN